MIETIVVCDHCHRSNKPDRIRVAKRLCPDCGHGQLKEYISLEDFEGFGRYCVAGNYSLYLREWLKKEDVPAKS